MTRLPKSFRDRNRTKRSFREQYAKLTPLVQKLTKDGCRLFNDNPEHPSFRIHTLEERKGASHVPGSVSVSINLQYRAIYVEEDGINWWYWIGTHAEYKHFTKSKN